MISRFLPTGWAIDAVQRATAPQDSIDVGDPGGVLVLPVGAIVWVEIAALALSALVLLVLASRAFRFR